MALIEINKNPSKADLKWFGLIFLLFFALVAGIVFYFKRTWTIPGTILGVAALGAMALIVCSILFGFHLGMIFSVAMVALAGGYVLYYTSNVLHHYRTDQYVAAALALFSALALLFWYILRIFLASRR